MMFDFKGVKSTRQTSGTSHNVVSPSSRLYHRLNGFFVLLWCFCCPLSSYFVCFVQRQRQSQGRRRRKDLGRGAVVDGLTWMNDLFLCLALLF